MQNNTIGTDIPKTLYNVLYFFISCLLLIINTLYNRNTNAKNIPVVCFVKIAIPTIIPAKKFNLGFFFSIFSSSINVTISIIHNTAKL